jgi:CMP-N-acetylneuraminic acid synthetase
MKTYAFIFARKGSKGLPNKNIKKILNKPLIEYTLEIINKIPEIKKCFVSSDSFEIGKIAKKYGAIWIKRPFRLSKDNSSEWDAWRHAIKFVRKKFGDFDKFVSLPATSPLKKIKDIKKCIIKLDKRTDIVITFTEASRSPWFNMVKFNNKGYLRLVLKNNLKISRRQDSPKVFDMTTICYVTRPDFILKKKNIWQGKVQGVSISKENALDIDTNYDFKIAKFLLKERLSKIKL